MKVTFRVPTEMYAFVEVEKDFPNVMPTEELRGYYEELSQAFKSQPEGELPKKEFDSFIDRYLCEEPVHSEEYNAMSKSQQDIVQVIKRSKKRIQAKLNKYGQNELG